MVEPNISRIIQTTIYIYIYSSKGIICQKLYAFSLTNRRKLAMASLGYFVRPSNPITDLLHTLVIMLFTQYRLP